MQQRKILIPIHSNWTVCCKSLRGPEGEEDNSSPKILYSCCYSLRVAGASIAPVLSMRRAAIATHPCAHSSFACTKPPAPWAVLWNIGSPCTTNIYGVKGTWVQCTGAQHSAPPHSAIKVDQDSLQSWSACWIRRQDLLPNVFGHYFHSLSFKGYRIMLHCTA